VTKSKDDPGDILKLQMRRWDSRIRFKEAVPEPLWSPGRGALLLAYMRCAALHEQRMVACIDE
jgi:hypothetical protein